jgi:hypothetical protein
LIGGTFDNFAFTCGGAAKVPELEAL